jgi:aspartate carbamoyltransferase regulatory subunit
LLYNAFASLTANEIDANHPLMCVSCQSFHQEVQIRLPRELNGVIRRASKAVIDGKLTVVEGSLERSDYVSCKLKCASCAQAFELECETYHGAGGHGRPTNTT